MFTRGKGRFMPLEYKPPKEMPDDQYPMVLTTKRSLYQYHSGTMTHKVRELNALLPEGTVEINPLDAMALSVNDLDRVKVISRRGEVKATARVTGLTPPGVVSMDFHFADVPTNTLTNPARDPVSKIPELKVCAVRVEKV
jgi:formate dehydrogenase major subunit/formate dehydrogenase alpha subunit